MKGITPGHAALVKPYENKEITEKQRDECREAIAQRQAIYECAMRATVPYCTNCVCSHSAGPCCWLWEYETSDGTPEYAARKVQFWKYLADHGRFPAKLPFTGAWVQEDV